MTCQELPENWFKRDLITVALLLSLSLLPFLSNTAIAQPEVQGEVWGHWPVMFGDTVTVIYVTGSITVPRDSTLEIDPGTSIIFRHTQTRLLVDGLLLAEGDSLNHIRFFQQQQWMGINFSDSSDNASILEWCELTNCLVGIACRGSSPTFRNNHIISESHGIQCINSSPEIQNNTIVVGSDRSLFDADGIYLELNSDAVIRNNSIEVHARSDEDVTGINIQNSSPVISGNWINVIDDVIGSSNVHGIFIWRSGNAVIEYNIIRTQTHNHMYGISLNQSFEAHIQNNTIHMIGSASSAIGIDATHSQLMIKNNIILGNRSIGVGISTLDDSEVVPGSGYNDLWNHLRYYEGIWEGDETDIIEDPLLDSLLWNPPQPSHYTPRWENPGDEDEIKSPCIDAGDPTILDPDETRSDIGARYYRQEDEVGVKGQHTQPVSFNLIDVYPNPFNSTLTLEVTIPVAQPTIVTSFSVTGRRIQDIWNGNLTQGNHLFHWSPNDLPAGEYLIRFDSGGKNEIMRVIYLP